MNINNLNNSARARHTKFMQYVLTKLGLKNNTGRPFKLLTRLGGRRSADGIVFDIGNGKVAKCIFTGRGAVNNINVIKKEYKIAKLMSDAGAGPKVYGMKEFKLPKTLLNLKNNLGSAIKNWPTRATLLRSLANKYKERGYGGTANANRNLKNAIKYGVNRSLYLNLFQDWSEATNNSYKQVMTGAVIIMENLYKGPGVKTAMTLYEYVTKEKKPYPMKEIGAAYKKMHSLKIAHQDLHAGNIMVQIKTDGSIRVVIIDFGRAAYPASKMTMNLNGYSIANFARFAGISNSRINSAIGRPGAPSVHLPFKSALSVPISAPKTYALMKAASGGYRIKGKRGPKKVDLTMAQLYNYANKWGVLVPAKATKKQLLDLIHAARGGVMAAPEPIASSYGFVLNKGSVRMRGKKGPKKVTLTVAQLKAYAAKKGINLMGAKLKKNILQRLAK